MSTELLTEWLIDQGLGPEFAAFLGLIGGGLGIFLLALAGNFAAKLFIRVVVHPIITRTSISWDDLLIEHNVIVRFSHIVPAAIINFYAPAVFPELPKVLSALQVIINTYLIVIALLIIDAALNFARALWDRSKAGQRYPAKSFIQAAKLVINLIGLIFILSALLGKSPLVFFSGLGAITAILLLIFKDAILGLVAGFQLSVNNMVAVGDWIAMPGRGADGPVIDVSLTTVKVQNFDKTITTIPTYALISDSFTNWRGMSEAGGRRIKRPIHIDMRTIAFADDAMLERFKRIKLLRPYLDERLDEIQKYNADVGDDLEELINGRRLTNVGTFRAYCLAYLQNHPKSREDLTLLVRHLAPGPHGLPIEIYVFANDTAWPRYEAIQADIFDHLLSILPEFGLSAFQAPSGADLERVGSALGPAQDKEKPQEDVAP
jgi:miniconductance mechanosensitive channel